MLTTVVAHAGAPIAPHDLLSWSAWVPDPVILVGVVTVAIIHHRGLRNRRSAGLFRTGLAVVALALLTPLEAVSSSLVSAHMVQHLLLMTVAAPLIAAARPWPALLRGAPRWVREANHQLVTSVPLDSHHRLRSVAPAAAWLLATGSLWFWHARRPYELAASNDLMHAAQHLCFLGAGLAVWTVVLRRDRRSADHPAAGLLLLFTLGLQTTLLAALMTFARSPWYGAYATTTAPWGGLDPLADQQLAGALMWFPTGVVHLGAAVWILVRWLAASEEGDTGSVRLRTGRTG